MQCDDEEQCHGCKTAQDKTNKFGCQRGGLRDELKDILARSFLEPFPYFQANRSKHRIARAPNEWLIRTSDNFLVKLPIIFQNPDMELHDLPFDPSSPVLYQHPDDILAYLGQFEGINNFWGQYCEPPTEEMISICARYQATLLE